jgi:hypothetical protein
VLEAAHKGTTSPCPTSRAQAPRILGGCGSFLSTKLTRRGLHRPGVRSCHADLEWHGGSQCGLEGVLYNFKYGQVHNDGCDEGRVERMRGRGRGEAGRRRKRTWQGALSLSFSLSLSRSPAPPRTLPQCSAQGSSGLNFNFSQSRTRMANLPLESPPSPSNLSSDSASPYQYPALFTLSWPPSTLC